MDAQIIVDIIFFQAIDSFIDSDRFPISQLSHFLTTFYLQQMFIANHNLRMGRDERINQSNVKPSDVATNWRNRDLKLFNNPPLFLMKGNWKSSDEYFLKSCDASLH